MHLQSRNYSIFFVTIAGLLSLVSASYADTVYQNFDTFPVTGESEIPGNSSDGWTYSSQDTNTGYTYYNSSGYWKSDGPLNTTVHDSFNLGNNTYNSAHMGWSTFQYFEIDDQISIHGNSLKITVTGGAGYAEGIDDVCWYHQTEGGAGNCDHFGKELHSKEQYLNYLNSDIDPVYHGDHLVGTPFLYFLRQNSVGTEYGYYGHNGDTNRLSLYVYLPDTVDNTKTLNNFNYLENTIGTGPYSTAGQDIGGHWYHNWYTRGGGWVHVLQDTHPQHNNSWSAADRYPYPSNSMRSYGTAYYDEMYRFYLSLYPIDGIGHPKYFVWLDEIEFQYDAEPQNDETINSPGILYRSVDKSFEVTFSAKYKNQPTSDRTYQIRYSFLPITNTNWNTTKPTLIQEDTRFFRPIDASSEGIFKKVSPYYPSVWAHFRLTPEDEATLEPGQTVYFAIKDVSQDPNDLSKVNPEYNYGVPYAEYPERYDFAGDAPALPLIKRIDYYIAGGPPENKELPFMGNSPEIFLIRKNN